MARKSVRSKSSRRPRRTKTLRRSTAIAQPGLATRPSLVNWKALSAIALALAESASAASADNRTLERLLYDWLAPYWLLDMLHRHARLSLQGDRNASCALARRLRELARQTPLLATSAHESLAQDMPAGCEGCAAVGPVRSAVDALLNFDALIEILAAAHRLSPPEAQERPALALGVAEVIGLCIQAAPLERLHETLSTGGRPALVTEVQWLARLQASDPPFARPMSLQGPPGGPFPGPGLPGGWRPPPDGDFPGRPPVGPPGDPDRGLPGVIRDMLKMFRKKPRWWDPEIWDHAPIRKGPILDTRTLQCLLAYGRWLQGLPPPPARPPRVVWSDNITSIRTTGKCAGDTLVISGTSFGKPKPAGVGIVLSINGRCTPLDVAPGDWTDTRIEVRLPLGITSGAIGFVDLNYVNTYNAWVDTVNADWEVARVLAGCAGIPAPKIKEYFSECPPLTPVNFLLAGDATIRAFTANGEALATAEPGDTVFLQWDVLNAEGIELERLSASGPLLNGGTRLKNLPAVGDFTLPAPGHTGPVTYRYRLTALGPCGDATETITIVATRHPRLRIERLEVTQGIQTLAQSVRLVAQKPTVVRVTVRHGLAGWGTDTVPKVAGRVRAIAANGGAFPWVDAANGSAPPMAATPGASITVKANPQRSSTDDLLNFLVPTWQCVDEVRFDIEVRVDAFDARDGFAGHRQSARAMTQPLRFEPRRILDLRYVRVNWGGNTPTDPICQRTLAGAVPLLPTPMAVISPLAGVGVQVPSGTNDAGRNDLLDDFDDRHNCSTWESLTEWLGSDCPVDDGAYWVLIPGVFYQGRAYDIPSNVCFTPPDDGPYAAHELAHCLNQEHVGVMCVNGQTAGGGDAPSEWPDGGLVQDVPFDWTRNSALSDPNGIWDLMTYCSTYWPGVPRWDRLWNEVGS